MRTNHNLEAARSIYRKLRDARIPLASIEGQVERMFEKFEHSGEFDLALLSGKPIRGLSPQNAGQVSEFIQQTKTYAIRHTAANTLRTFLDDLDPAELVYHPKHNEDLNTHIRNLTLKAGLDSSMRNNQVTIGELLAKIPPEARRRPVENVTTEQFRSR